MPIRDWFDARKKSKQLDSQNLNAKLSDEAFCKLWTQCFQCRASIPTRDLNENNRVCTECGYHFRIGARDRIALLTDSFVEHDADLIPGDPLKFTDTEPYIDRQASALKKSRLNEAVITGEGKMNGLSVALAVMDFTYLGGSMGSVVGEKITRIIEHALQYRLPVLIICSSGGARMQEGTLSLMQMVKTGAAMARLHDARLFCVTLLTEPTFGGVTASFGTLGDLLIAEEGARIGFAGRRVIEQTIRQKLPDDFQTASYLLKYGQLDMVLNRHEMKEKLTRLYQIHHKAMEGVSVPVQFQVKSRSVVSQPSQAVSAQV